jgi:glycosyltransferase involved in cell wall biosynthesis
MIRVAHVCTVDLSLRYLLLNQLKYLQEHGFHVTGISNPGPDVPHLEQHGIPHLAVPMTRNFTPLADLKALQDLERVFKRERFTLIHTHNPKPGLIGQLAARLAGSPVVVNTLHGFYFHEHMKPLPRRFYILMEQIAAGQSDVILSQNPEDVATAVREHIARPDRIFHLGNGIDLSRFSRARLDEEHQASLRAALGLDGPVVGFVGRLVQEKGILELFEAMRAVRAKVPGAKLLVIGPLDSEKKDALTPHTAKRYGLEDACVFTGMRQDMPELYALMDVFALPSHREGFPRSPMEASAMGVPSVVTDIRGCRETVVAGETGLFVPLKAPGPLADALLELLTDPARSRRMGQAARLLAERKFDERHVFRTVLSHYVRLLASRGLPVPEAAIDELGR